MYLYQNTQSFIAIAQKFGLQLGKPVTKILDDLRLTYELGRVTEVAKSEMLTEFYPS